jgi:hypothetical protein
VQDSTGLLKRYTGIQNKRAAFLLHSPINHVQIDVFVPEDTPFARANMHRRVALEVPEVGRTLYFCGPEDIYCISSYGIEPAATFLIASGMISKVCYGCRRGDSIWPTFSNGLMNWV